MGRLRAKAKILRSENFSAIPSISRFSKRLGPRFDCGKKHPTLDFLSLKNKTGSNTSQFSAFWRGSSVFHILGGRHMSTETPSLENNRVPKIATCDNPSLPSLLPPISRGSPWARDTGQGPWGWQLPAFQPPLRPVRTIRPLTIPQHGHQDHQDHQDRQAGGNRGPRQPPVCPPSPTGPSQSNRTLVLDIPLRLCPLGLITAS